MEGRRALTSALAAANGMPLRCITNAMTTLAEREMPAAQCTSTLPKRRGRGVRIRGGWHGAPAGLGLGF